MRYDAGVAGPYVRPEVLQSMMDQSYGNRFPLVVGSLASSLVFTPAQDVCAGVLVLVYNLEGFQGFFLFCFFVYYKSKARAKRSTGMGIFAILVMTARSRKIN
jgi:hypothetical protein